jgi:VWFA-related protein
MDFMGKLLILLLASPLIRAQAPQVPAAPAEETPVFRAGVSIVRVDAQVVDGRKVLGNLDRAAFRIFDEGVEQPIAYFGRDSEPIWLLLLLDVSGSMKRRLEEMAAVSRKALEAFGPEDRVSVMFFGRVTRLAQPFTGDRQDAAAAIGEAPGEKSVGSGTAINAALLDAARAMRDGAQAGPGRRAIVILTDNESLNYQVTDEAVLEALYSADAVLNAIVTPDARPPEAPKRGLTLNPDFTPADVFKLARETGGEVLKAERAGETFREMMERIRIRYSLHYRAPEGTPGTTRRLRVELSPEAKKRFPRAEVRARTGYRVQ